MYPFTIGMLVSSADLWEETQAALRGLPVRVAFEMTVLGTVGVLVEKVERYRPEIVLIDAAGLENQLPEILFEIRQTAAAPRVVILSKSSDPEKILTAVRAGASEYLYSPFDKALGEAFERLSRDIGRAKDVKQERRAGKIFGFLSAKGGCGATTLACHAAVEMPNLTEEETLLADLDLSVGMVRFLTQAKSRYSVVDAMRNLQRLDGSYWGSIVSNGRPSLEIVGSPIDEAWKDMPGGHEIRHVLRFARSHYPWVIADLGRGLDHFVWNAIQELDQLVLVSTMEVPALHRAKIMSRQLMESGFHRDQLRLVVNRVPRKNDVGTAELEEVLGLKVYEAIPNDYRGLEEAYAEGRLLDRDSPVRRRIGRLSAKLAGLEPQQTPKRRFALFG